MDPKTLLQLVEQARDDPKFFHALVFAPENVLNNLEYLNEAVRNTVRHTDPMAVLAFVVGEIAACGGGETCSCTSGTCSGTCGGSTCSVTCSGDSCGRTCDNSCGYTTDLQDLAQGPWEIVNPATRFASDLQFYEGEQLAPDDLIR